MPVYLAVEGITLIHRAGASVQGSAMPAEMASNSCSTEWTSSSELAISQARARAISSAYIRSSKALAMYAGIEKVIVFRRSL